MWTARDGKERHAKWDPSGEKEIDVGMVLVILKTKRSVVDLYCQRPGMGGSPHGSLDCQYSRKPFSSALRTVLCLEEY